MLGTYAEFPIPVVIKHSFSTSFQIYVFGKVQKCKSIPLFLLVVLLIGSANHIIIGTKSLKMTEKY